MFKCHQGSNQRGGEPIQIQSGGVVILNKPLLCLSYVFVITVLKMEHVPVSACCVTTLQNNVK